METGHVWLLVKASAHCYFILPTTRRESGAAPHGSYCVPRLAVSLMATNDRYYPDGFIGTEQATILLAKLLHPERWRAEDFFAGEQSMWDGFGFDLNALAIHGFICDVARRIHKSDPTVDLALMWERYGDFNEALNILRQRLHAGRLQSQFCDENGHFGSIRKEGWGGDGGVDALLTGVVCLDDGFRRLVLLPKAAIEKLGRSTRDGMKQSSGKAASDKLPKNAPCRLSRKGENLFREWRQQFEQREGRFPSRAEDEAYMREQGYSRDYARKFRKKSPSRPRGRPAQHAKRGPR